MSKPEKFYTIGVLLVGILLTLLWSVYGFSFLTYGSEWAWFFLVIGSVAIGSGITIYIQSKIKAHISNK